MKLSEKIVELRKGKDMTQEELAEICGVKEVHSCGNIVIAEKKQHATRVL